MPDIWLIVLAVSGLAILALLAWWEPLLAFLWGLSMPGRGFRVTAEGDSKASKYKTNTSTSASAFPESAKVTIVRWRGTNSRLVMQIAMSLILLCAGLYVILSQKYVPADTNWAYGMVGTIIGYWLKGK